MRTVDALLGRTSMYRLVLNSLVVLGLAAFVLSSTGVLAFLAAPDFEGQTDAGGNNVYDVTVQVSDNNGGIDTQAIAVTVTNVAGVPQTSNAPIITGTGESDVLTGLAGANTLRGLGDNDTLTGGAGNDVVTVETTSGFTRIEGDAGDDRFVIGNAGLLDDLGTLLVLVGGAGTDSATLDDSAETDDQLGTITPDTVTGLDMVADGGQGPIYSVTVRGAGTFTITLAGFPTITLDRAATADQVVPRTVTTFP